MGEMRDSDWSRENLLRSDWLGPKGASITTDGSDSESYAKQKEKKKNIYRSMH